MSNVLLNPQIDLYISDGCGRCKFYQTAQCKVNSWTTELKALREIILRTGLKEELKWSMPCYTFNGKNILLLCAFKDFVSISFFKGYLLNDPHQVLQQAGANSRIARLIKFTSLSEINGQKDIILGLIKEAMAIESKDKQSLAAPEQVVQNIPYELLHTMEENSAFREAFYNLTPGRRRGYLIYFSAPKQSQTKLNRIMKCIPRIMDGKGLQD